MEVKGFHLNNRMDRDEFIMIQISMIPQEFVEKYNLTEKSHNGYIYARGEKGMYGLPQSGQISHDALVKTYSRLDTTNQAKKLDYGNTIVNQ